MTLNAFWTEYNKQQIFVSLSFIFMGLMMAKMLNMLMVKIVMARPICEHLNVALANVSWRNVVSMSNVPLLEDLTLYEFYRLQHTDDCRKLENLNSVLMHWSAILTDLPLELLTNIVLSVFGLYENDIPTSLYNDLRQSCHSLKNAVDSIPKCVSVDVDLVRDHRDLVTDQPAPGRQQSIHKTLSLMTKNFWMVDVLKNYKMVTAPRLIDSSNTTGRIQSTMGEYADSVSSSQSTFLSVAECKMKVTHYAMANQDPIQFVNLIKQFVGFTVLQGVFTTYKYEIVFREVDLCEYRTDSAQAINNMRKCLQSFVPKKVTLDSPDLDLLQNLTQSSLGLKIHTEVTNPLENLLPLSQLNYCLQQLEIDGFITSYEGLDHLTELTHLSVYPDQPDSDILECLNESNIDLSILKNLSYLHLQSVEPNMDDFLSLNKLLPSLSGFGVINLNNKPHDLIVSQTVRDTLPKNCNLERLLELRVSVRVLSSVTFTSLIEAMVNVFTGVKKNEY
ncbi:hypothetical protein HDU76_002919 [Blyttiomyces sp. JEL0837]|nr:hypothetical protein HDU76_002919 [Blyttiomyces sp. JEL0837]